MDPLSLAVGAGIAAVAFAAGRVTRRRSPAPQSIQPVCGCGHHRSMHDPGTGECHGKVRRGNWLDGVRHVPCTCRQYVGPEPITSLWVPPALTGDGDG